MGEGKLGRKSMKKPKLIVMVGLPGSGKSTYAKELVKNKKADIILSSDAIREELTGDENNQTVNDKVFKLLYQRMNDYLADGKNVVVDATNTTLKSRLRIMSECKVDCTKEAVVVNPTVLECYKRDSSRDRTVGEQVINRFLSGFQCPQKFEGFDSIKFTEKKTHSTSLSDIINRMKEFDQENPHHIFSLGKHCLMLELELKKLGIANSSVLYAGLIHDVGKLFTKNKDDKGIAHYYNHDSIGTYYIVSHYKTFFFDKDIKDPLLTIFLVNYHMRAHKDFKTPKAENKYRRLFGNELYELLIKFGECDMKATGTYENHEQIMEGLNK